VSLPWDGLRTLEEVVRWALPRGHEIVEVVVQDEYTHDVVVACRDGRWLVFDTT
jgi:hypothetical protein